MRVAIGGRVCVVCSVCCFVVVCVVVLCVFASVCVKLRGVVGRASPIAQLVERVAVNRKVAGSNPAGREASSFAAHYNTHS